MSWWELLLTLGLVLTVLLVLWTLLAVLTHMYVHHGVTVHWKCDKGDNEYHEDPTQDWEVRR